GKAEKGEGQARKAGESIGPAPSGWVEGQSTGVRHCVSHLQLLLPPLPVWRGGRARVMRTNGSDSNPTCFRAPPYRERKSDATPSILSGSWRALSSCSSPSS